MLDTLSSRRLLMVDPGPDCLELMAPLRSQGWRVDCCDVRQVAEQPCEVGLFNVQAEHLEQLPEIREMLGRSGGEWIAVLSAELLQVPRLVDAVCSDFVDIQALPISATRLRRVLERALDRAKQRGQGVLPYDQQQHPLQGESGSIRALRLLLGKFAQTTSPILIHGEQGAGKAWAAWTLHRQSRRAGGPFIRVDCGAIPEHLIQSHLFGHPDELRGDLPTVGQVEAANGGTLCLSHVERLPVAVQAQLLRFMLDRPLARDAVASSGRFDVRVVATTSADLEKAIANGQFCEGLYYRLNVLQLTLAPLREREADLMVLASHFLQAYDVDTLRSPRSFSEEAKRAIALHCWPGNVRELAYVIRRALLVTGGRPLQPVDLGLADAVDRVATMSTLEAYKDRAERQALCDALDRHGNNLTLAAKILGISRPTFYRLLHKHQLR